MPYLNMIKTFPKKIESTFKIVTVTESAVAYAEKKKKKKNQEN